MHFDDPDTGIKGTADLNPDQAVLLAARALWIAGKTSLTLNPDDTYTTTDAS